jgi:cysteine-rich repeat protein
VAADYVALADPSCQDVTMQTGDGCGFNCLVEVGWNCTGGNPTTKDTCIEICGDGLDFGHYQCDDGDNL